MRFIRRARDTYRGWPRWARIAAPVTAGFLAIGALAGPTAPQPRTSGGEIAAGSSTTTTAPPAPGTPDTTATTATAGPGSTTTTRPPAPTTTVPTTTLPPTSAPPAAPPAGGHAPLAQLQVAAERPASGYARDLFPHWIDADGDRCDTREEVLMAESRTPPQVDPYGCKVVAGDWVSVYDGVTTDQPGDLEVDHVVALAEAWDSGAAAWDTNRRRDFANDLGYAGSLIAVTGSSNQSKSDRDPAGWLPPRREAWCSFATDWVNVKVRWGLTADEAEVAALRTALGTCDGSSGGPATPVPTAPTTTTAPPPAATSGGPLTVTALDCGGERVTVTNGGTAPAALTGWAIHDEGTKHSFAFPAGYTLAAGASVTVASGGAAGPGELQWTTAPVWNNDGDTASLVDDGGGTRSTKAC